MEQYIMQSKALFHSDTDKAVQIMRETNPGRQKALGREVAGYDKEKWHAHVPIMLKHGLKAKFNQVISCKAFLSNTGNKTLGEASKFNNFWGIGMGLRDKDVWNKDKWGLNHMGKALMDIRSEF